MILCTMPECQTTAGCLCQKRGIIGGFGSTEAIYDAWLQAKDAEITRLRSELANARNTALEEASWLVRSRPLPEVTADNVRWRTSVADSIAALKAEGGSRG